MRFFPVPERARWSSPCVLMVLACGTSAASAQLRIFEEPLSPRIANYDIREFVY